MTLFWGGDVKVGIGKYDNNDHHGVPIVGYVMMFLSVIFSTYVLYSNVSQVNHTYMLGAFSSIRTPFSFFPEPGESFDFILLSFNAVLSLLVEINLLALWACLFYFWVFADNVEYAMGHLRFILFCVIAGYLSLWVTYAIMKPIPIPLSGFTAVVAAVIGAYIRIFPRVKFDLHRHNNILDGRVWYTAFVPFTRVVWAQVGVKTYACFWFVLCFIASYLGTLSEAATASTYFCYQLVGMVTGYGLCHFFRDPKISILDQHVPTYKEHLEYVDKNYKGYSEKAARFSNYSHKAIDPTLIKPDDK